MKQGLFFLILSFASVVQGKKTSNPDSTLKCGKGLLEVNLVDTSLRVFNSRTSRNDHRSLGILKIRLFLGEEKLPISVRSYDESFSYQFWNSDEYRIFSFFSNNRVRLPCFERLNLSLSEHFIMVVVGVYPNQLEVFLIAKNSLIDPDAAKLLDENFFNIYLKTKEVGGWAESDIYYRDQSDLEILKKTALNSFGVENFTYRHIEGSTVNVKFNFSKNFFEVIDQEESFKNCFERFIDITNNPRFGQDWDPINELSEESEDDWEKVSEVSSSCDSEIPPTKLTLGEQVEEQKLVESFVTDDPSFKEKP